MNIQQSHVALTVVTDPVSQTLKVDFYKKRKETNNILDKNKGPLDKI